MAWKTLACLFLGLTVHVHSALAEGDWEITPESEAALDRGLTWLARNQGPDGNWESNDVGLVSMGTLAFLSAGHTPGKGKYGPVVQKSLDYMLRNVKPSGLLNVADQQRDMYNHGLATFVLGQAYGMTHDERIGKVLDRALKLIANTQCEDGGWDYQARRQQNGHDLSLAVMQAKALRSAVDSGLEVNPEVIELAIKSVREHYRARNGRGGKGGVDDPAAQEGPGQFTYDGGRGTLAMAAAGVVCLQEFGQYQDWRIEKNMDVIRGAVLELRNRGERWNNRVPFDAYTLYYVGQALYQVGDPYWKDCYEPLRDHLVANQIRKSESPQEHGAWHAAKWVDGKPAYLYGTGVACFVLAMPNRYLPILQKVESLKNKGAAGAAKP